MTNPVCCPKFNTSKWDEKISLWKGKLFLQDNVIQFMHFPLNMGQVITRMMYKIESNKVAVNNEDFLMLCYDPSPWKSEINITITKPISGEKINKLSGEFVSKVFDGPYNMVPTWIKEMDKFLANKNKKAIKYYFHYAYCPKCSQKYGHNYVVAFAQTK